MAVAAFSEAKWYPDTPSEIYNLSHLTCPPNWGKSSPIFRIIMEKN